MGAGTCLAYLVYCGLKKIPHHISKVILMAPAGIHDKIPQLGILTAPIAEKLFPLFGVYSIRIPSKTLRTLAVKLLQDINNNPGARDLLAFLLSRLVTGGKIENIPSAFVHNMMYNLLTGTSNGVLRHFLQLWRSGKFQAYDYGSQRNLKEYGSPTPLNFMDHYN